MAKICDRGPISSLATSPRVATGVIWVTMGRDIPLGARPLQIGNGRHVFHIAPRITRWSLFSRGGPSSPVPPPLSPPPRMGDESSSGRREVCTIATNVPPTGGSVTTRASQHTTTASASSTSSGRCRTEVRCVDSRAARRCTQSFWDHLDGQIPRVRLVAHPLHPCDAYHSKDAVLSFVHRWSHAACTGA